MWSCWLCRPKKDDKLLQMIAETQSMQRDLMTCVNAVLHNRNTTDRPEIRSVTRGSTTPVACEFYPSTLPCRQVVKAARPMEAEANGHEKVKDATQRGAAPIPPPPPRKMQMKSHIQHHSMTEVRKEKPASGLQSALLNEISDATADIPAFLANARQRRSP